MNVHLFGATSSPSCIIFGMKKLASDYAKEFPEASVFINDSFYLDDGLIFVPTASEAVRLVKDAQTLMKKGNLVLHQFLSDNADVTQALRCDGPSVRDFGTVSNASSADTFRLSVDFLSHPKFKMKDETYSLLPGTVDEPNLYSRKRWRRVQFIAQQFWSRWKKEYLQNLQQRQKWNNPRRNVLINDIVLLVDDDKPHSQWRLARVTHTFPSRDGLTRKVRVHPGEGQDLDRPIQKLVVLVPAKPRSSDEENSGEKFSLGV